MAVEGNSPVPTQGNVSSLQGAGGTLRGASLMLHLAQTHCNADVGDEVRKDTLVPVLCLDRLPLAQIRVLQPDF